MPEPADIVTDIKKRRRTKKKHLTIKTCDNGKSKNHVLHIMTTITPIAKTLNRHFASIVSVNTFASVLKIK